MSKVFPHLLIILVTSSLSLAETKQPGSVGRYNDGRAFRVDSQGYQLSDQIAELEVTIKEQEKQVLECESRLEKASNGLPPPAACPKTTSQEVNAASCTAFTNPLQNRVAALEESVSFLQNRLAKAPKTEAIAEMNEQTNSLKSSLSSQQAALSEKEDLLGQGKEKIAALQKELNETKNSLAAKESELEKKTEREKELLAKLNTAGKKSTSQPVELASATPKTDSSRAMMAGSSAGPSGASATTKKSLQNELAEIQKLVIRRKDLYDSMKTAKKGVTTSLQPLHTSRQVTLDQLRTRATNPTSEEEAANTLTGLIEIRALLQSDIQVLDRLLKRL